MDNNELTHWGIRGMRWGVRRYQNKDGSLTAAGKNRLKTEDYHEDYNKAHSSKSVKTMSDKELRERLNRLQMEKQYSQISKREKSFGEKFVTGVLTDAAKQTASKYVSKYMTKGIDILIEKSISKNRGN